MNHYSDLLYKLVFVSILTGSVNDIFLYNNMYQSIQQNGRKYTDYFWQSSTYRDTLLYFMSRKSWPIKGSRKKILRPGHNPSPPPRAYWDTLLSFKIQTSSLRMFLLLQIYLMQKQQRSSLCRSVVLYIMTMTSLMHLVLQYKMCSAKCFFFKWCSAEYFFVAKWFRIEPGRIAK